MIKNNFKKTNWQTKKLDKVCFFQEGPGIRKYEYKKNGYPIINVRCVQDGYVDLSKAQAVDPKFIDEKWGHFQVQEDDILFTTSGSIGRTAMVSKKDLPLLMNTSVVRFKSLDQRELDKHFLAWLLRSPEFIEKVKSYSSGTAQKNVGPTHLKLISISYPPLPEQHRIVKILDEVFADVAKAKENAEKNLQNSKDLFESYLNNIFTNPEKDWEEKTLKEITSLLGDGLHGTPKYTIDGEYYFINGNNLNNGNIVFKENTKRVSVEEYNKYRKNLNDRTILVSINGTLCNVAFFNNEKIILGKSACYFNLLDGVDKNFIKYIILSPYFIRYAFKEATGATIKNVSLKTMREFKIYLPGLKEQKSIVAKLDALSAETRKLEMIYQQKLADLEELKKSILNKAFTGEL